MKISFEEYPEIRAYLASLNSKIGHHFSSGAGLFFPFGLHSDAVFIRVDEHGENGNSDWYFDEVPGLEEFLKANYPEFFL